MKKGGTENIGTKSIEKNNKVHTPQQHIHDVSATMKSRLNIIFAACLCAATAPVAFSDLSCVIGDPSGMCLDDTGLLEPRVALFCRVFPISTHLVHGKGCESLNFTCPKALPQNDALEKLLFKGMKAFQNRTAAGDCPSETAEIGVFSGY